MKIGMASLFSHREQDKKNGVDLLAFFKGK
jgi:hypothetical protein